MMRNKFGLLKKITLLCVLMAIIISIGVCVGGYYLFSKSTFQIYNNFAYDIAYLADSYIDADTITDYLKTMKTDEKYDEMADHLFRLYKYYDLLSIYICVPDKETLNLTNIYDARVRVADDPSTFALGVKNQITVKDPYDLINIYESGKPKKNDYFIRTSSFGYTTSACIPVLDSNGKSSALLIVDVKMPTIIKQLQQYFLITVAITVILVSVIVFLYLIVLRKQVIEPIQSITKNAHDFASTRKSFSESAVNIKTGDEIETLADALCTMEADITKYIDNLAKVTAEREHIAAELNVATTIQTDMLPSIFPPYPDCDAFDIYAMMDPAKEVGGDFYDFFMIDNTHLGLVMADVSGKGIPAALFMVISKTLIKNNALPGVAPKTVLETTNRQLCENNDASMFVTVWFGILDISTGVITAVNAGHEKPLIKRKDGDFEYLRDKHGMMLAALSMSKYKEYEIQLNPGDKLFLYTDGLLEATNSSNELYGEDRALVSMNRHKDESIKDFLEHIYNDANEFVGEAPQFDDLTMMILEYYGQNTPAPEKQSGTF